MRKCDFPALAVLSQPLDLSSRNLFAVVAHAFIWGHLFLSFDSTFPSRNLPTFLYFLWGLRSSLYKILLKAQILGLGPESSFLAVVRTVGDALAAWPSVLRSADGSDTGEALGAIRPRPHCAIRRMFASPKWLQKLNRPAPLLPKSLLQHYHVKRSSSCSPSRSFLVSFIHTKLKAFQAQRPQGHEMSALSPQTQDGGAMSEFFSKARPPPSPK